jgi:hypothetical protein
LLEGFFTIQLFARPAQTRMQVHFFSIKSRYNTLWLQAVPDDDDRLNILILVAYPILSYLPLKM